jgi:hypothetical protein
MNVGFNSGTCQQGWWWVFVVLCGAREYLYFCGGHLGQVTNIRLSKIP